MNRRQFLSSSGLAGVAATKAGAAPEAFAPAPSKRALMNVSADVEPVDAKLKAVARYGIKHIVSHPEIAGGRLYATVEEQTRMREAAERNGMSVDVLPPPNLASS